MVIMKDKVSNKLSEVFKSLEAAKKYGVDVRMEERKLAECNISFTTNVYSSDQRYNKVTDYLIKTEQDRYNSLLKELVVLEKTILDKRKIYQVRETLSGEFRKIKDGESLQDTQGFINEVKRQLKIYSSSRLLEIYSPNNVINEIFSIVYQAIKMEVWFNCGKSEILDMIISDEADMARISSFLSKDVFLLEKMLGANNESVIRIRNYRTSNKGESEEALVNQELVNMVVNATTSYQVEDNINLQTKGIQSGIDARLKDAKEKRKKYVLLARVQSEARKLAALTKRTIDKRIAPIALSIAIMGGVGLGTYHTLSSRVNNNDSESVVSVVSEEKNTKKIDSRIEIQENSNMPLSMAVGATLLSTVIPKIGFVFQGTLLVKDKKKYNRTIEEIVARKHEMEDLKSGLENIVEENSQCLKQISKQKEYMMWASVYSGMTEEQIEILNNINASLDASNHILETLDEEVMEDTYNKQNSRRLGQ